MESAPENESYWEDLKRLPCFNTCTRFELSQNKMAKFLLFRLRTKLYIKWKLKNYLSNDWNVNIFVDQSVIGQTFIKNGKRVNLFEHGSGNYVVGAYPNHKFLKKIIGVTEGYGRSNLVDVIYLQHPEKSPTDIKHKVKKLEIEKIFNNLTKEQKGIIFKLFSVPLDLASGGTIILTQPLSEDGFMPERKKIDIYKSMLNGNGTFYLKPHPREKTDYKRVLESDNVIVIDKKFPFELINFIGIKFEKVMTVSSGAIYNFHYPIEAVVYGTEQYPELVKPLGLVKYQIIGKYDYDKIEY
ncbi:glycosyltransferase family 52 [Vibrio hyugaensis]|uniref:glycosyltransferase family 52 n=1 Tax=Vibrio hyugaensis TaxID=1534743 RepID=UPI0012E0365C|nr:glycosyltransferase family 52 [Vibrio hyugaensis]